MNNAQRTFLFLLRVSMGGLLLYAGVTKILNPAWTAAGYLKGAKLLPGFYAWLASPDMISLVNFMNEWGLTLLGLSLLLGAGVRIAGVLGALMMFLYYLPLGFPFPNAHAFIVDEHIIYIFALLVLGEFQAGRAWGLDAWLLRQKFVKKNPLLKEILA